VIIDRLLIKENIEKRLADSLATASASQGQCKVELNAKKSFCSVKKAPALIAV